MKWLLSLVRIIDAINEGVGRFVSWITALLVLVIFNDVVMRYVFNKSFVFTQELEWHLFAFIFLVGAGYTLLHNGHVRVDIIYARLSPRTQAWVDAICCLIFLFPGCWLVLTTTIPFVENSFNMMEGSPDPGGIPYRWVLKACIPFGFLLLTLQGVALFIKSLLVALGLSAPAEEAH
ncbi:MAG: TRAP transporter small permease subunit [Desulfarculus sp.]|nr:TRAP transporter small permease subunit [Desulfarculus sp.]